MSGVGVEAEEMCYSGRLEGEEGGEEVGAGLSLGGYTGAVAAHIDFEEDLGDEGGVGMDDVDGGELGGMVDH